MKKNKTIKDNVIVNDEAVTEEKQKENKIKELKEKYLGNKTKIGEKNFNSKLYEFVKGSEKTADTDFILEELARLKQKEDWNNSIDNFFETNPDMADYAEEMAEYLLNNPKWLENPEGIEIAYNLIRSKRYGEFFDADEEAAAEKIYQLAKGNEKARQAIIEDYLKEVSNSNIPITLGKQLGGETPLSKPVKARNMKEAAKIAESFFRK